MKAWVLHGINDLRLEDVAEPVIAENEVMVQVKAAGICGSDVPRIYRTGAYRHPLIPGHEFSGRVVETGAKADAKWQGKRVGIFPLIPCRECLPCQREQYEMCRNYSYLGSRRDGAFAEYAAVPAWNLIELPGNVSYEEASMLEPMSVAVHAIRRTLAVMGTDMDGKAAEERTIAVCGLGTIGFMMVMFLREAGIKNLLAIGNKDFQRQTLFGMGLAGERYCDSRECDVGKWLMERTCGRGADVFFECVGKNETLTEAVDNTAPAGCICLVGNPYSDMHLEKKVYWKILRNQLRITGTWNSSFVHSERDDWHYVLERLSGKRIVPETLITHRPALEDLDKGLHIMRDKTEDYIKIIGQTG